MIKVNALHMCPKYLLDDIRYDNVVEHIQHSMGAKIGKHLVENANALDLDWRIADNPIYDTKEFFMRLNLLNNEEIDKIKEGLSIMRTSGLVETNSEIKMAYALIATALRGRDVVLEDERCNAGLLNR